MSPESQSSSPEYEFSFVRKSKILIIDDSLLLRKLLIDQLPSDRFEIYEAEDGATGLDIAEQVNPDLILLDYVMPRMDGYEVYQALRDRPRFAHTPVIVISGRHDEVVRQFGNPFGPCDFLPKQASRDQLCDRINAVLPMSVTAAETETAQPSVNVAVQDITAVMAHLGQLEHRLNDSQALMPLLPPLPATPRPTLLSQLPLIALTSIVTAAGMFAFSNLDSLRPESRLSRASKLESGSAMAAKPVYKNVAALGRLEPQGEITRLSAPNSLEGSRVEQLSIREGESVKAGQVVAILDSQTPRLATLKQAQSNVATARAQLAKVLAGAKSGDVNAQKANIIRLNAELNGGVAAQEAEIRRIEADLRNAQIERDRYENLNSKGAVSKSEFDSKQLRFETVQNQLSQARASLDRLISTVAAQKKEAQATLDSIAEVRPVDVQVARSEVESAMRAVEKAKADLDLTYVRAPFDGTVLEVNVRPGEIIGNAGIATLGKTDRMYVVAEVYETDIAAVRPGLNTVVTSNAFPGQLVGTVTEIGQQVKKQGIFDVNPLANTDFKVVEVKIRLDPQSSRKVASFSNLQVQVVIRTKASPSTGTASVESDRWSIYSRSERG
ncbi:response regulator [Altericista sp. CCNU0014]|uniref:response regulator n=1 Tax=Altericista sp. CCNU0014 TaxID=3082949 RepID=UPI00384F4D6A